MMKSICICQFLIYFALTTVACTNAYSINTNNADRRAFLTSTASKTVSVAVASGLVVVELAKSSVHAVDQDPYTDYITTDSGLRYTVLKEGTGDSPVPGAMVSAHYTGWLDGFDSIRKFDSSRDRGQPFKFAVAKGQVIRGWDEAFSSMTVGERRRIIIPPRLGYGDRGAGGIIPGGATLYFDVELLGIGR
jgi:peptidylprolyl isomerase